MFDAIDIETLLAISTILLFAFWSKPPKNKWVHGALSHWLRSQQRAPKYLFALSAMLVVERAIPHQYTHWITMAAGATTIALFFSGYSHMQESFWSRRRNRFLGLLILLSVWCLFFISTVRTEAYYLMLAAPIFHRSICDKRDFIKSNLLDIEALRHKATSIESLPHPTPEQSTAKYFDKSGQAS